jgi:N-acyl-D-amino-acid deacylase
MRSVFHFCICLLVLVSTPLEAQSFDLLLTNGRIVDGMGNSWYRADLGIRAGTIAEIGNLQGSSAARTIDVGGQVIAPGFIDMMGSTSTPLVMDPTAAESKLSQGITTMMVGEGDSDAPQSDDTLPRPLRDAGYRWNTLEQYISILDRRGIPVNVVFNVGATQVRTLVVGDKDRRPTMEQLQQMRLLVAEAMQSGAVGLSSALIYPPGAYASTDELVDLAKEAGRYGGFYSTHVRNEGNQLIASIEEALQIGKAAGVPVHIYHLKAAGQENWPLMQRAIDLIGAARAEGLDVTADVYPYVRNQLSLNAFINPRHFTEGTKAFLVTLSRADVRMAVKYEIEHTSDWENWYQHVERDWNNVLVVKASPAAGAGLEAKSIQEIARDRRQDPWNVFFNLVQAGGVVVNPKTMDEAQKQIAMRSEFISFSTDTPPLNPATTISAHPRAFGTFPRILGTYVRDEKVISLEMAIRKMTSLPANRLMLFDRGRIAPGMAADLVVCDPSTISDRATDDHPLLLSTGISLVIVNGRIEMDHGRFLQTMSGRVLRHSVRSELKPKPAQ